MKKIIVGFSVLLLVCIFTLLFIHKVIVVLWNTNTITLQVEAPLKKDELKVEYAMSTQFYKSTLNFSENMEYVFVFDGTTTKPIPNNYGENDFMISYANQYYVVFRHFKTNRRHQHDYKIHLYKKEDELYINVVIEGADEMNFERKMETIPNKKT